ncbi:MAG TPA: serine/threonine-protein kinase [Polyangia bacterium]
MSRPGTPGTEAAALVDTVLDGAYRLTRLIAEGGMGTVYEAVHLRLRKRVAVKVMVPELATDPEALARFRREVEVTSQLAHPHVIALLDFGVAPSGAPYLVMEYLDGEDLDQRLRRVQRLPLPAVSSIVSQTASALSTIHRQGIVHRDLKPANIFLLSLEGGEDFVKVVDFGISKVKTATTRLTRAFTMVGTPESMSPEQATGRVDEVDHRCDQWALACAAWRMTTGTRPFAGSTLTEFLQQVVSADPPTMDSLIPDAAPEVEFVLRRALAKRQDDRYPTIAAFARAFETAVARVAAAPQADRDTDHDTATNIAPAVTAPRSVAKVAGPVAAPLPVAPAAALAPAPASPPARRAPTAVLAVVTVMSLAIGAVMVYRAGGAAFLRDQYERATGQSAPPEAPPSRKARPTTSKKQTEKQSEK